jgi:hypothetical protein
MGRQNRGKSQLAESCSTANERGIRTEDYFLDNPQTPEERLRQKIQDMISLVDYPLTVGLGRSLCS